MTDADDDRRERQTLDDLAAGRPSALADLYDRHAASLVRHAYVLTRRRADAEDLVHSVFVRLATLGADALGIRRARPYLHRMVHTMWIDRERRSATSARVVDALDLPDVWVPPQDAAFDLRRAMDRLPVEQREVVVLHVLDGFSFREIGGFTGVSMFTAATRYRLALRRLRTSLSGQVLQEM